MVRTASAAGVGLMGIDGIMVEVQVGQQDGLPGIDVAGLPAASIREARHRVRSALRVAGIDWPNERLIANFAPADIPKSGTAFDLPLALAVLSFLDIVPQDALRDAVFYAELGLDGEVRPAPGAINAALATRDAAGKTTLYVAGAAAGEAAAVPDVQVVAVDDLLSLIDILRGEREAEPARPVMLDETTAAAAVDMSTVRGQIKARRALEISAAGGHNLLMIGPPGCG